MALRNKSRPEMAWQLMDCRNLKYPNQYFDLILDKTTIDCLLCGDNGPLSVLTMLYECHRVLKDEGKYVAISFGEPSIRIEHLKWFDVKVEVISRDK